ncbi:MAG: hypothetical protein EOP06_14335 [Proteobacteria bacterium]|nr:MAG: hypothetical protein EOP06_14335 [Pseudomonadota bacterium]
MVRAFVKQSKDSLKRAIVRGGVLVLCIGTSLFHVQGAISASAEPSMVNCQKLYQDVSPSEIIEISVNDRSQKAKMKVRRDEASLAESIRRTGKIYRNEAFWNFVESRPEIVDAQIARQYKTLVSLEDQQRIKAIAESLGTYRALLLDPAIAQRMDDFLFFTKKQIQAEPGISMAKLRQNYSDSFPKITIWHGGLFQGDELAEVEKKGITGNAFFAESVSAADGVVLDKVLGLKSPLYSLQAHTPVEDMKGRLGGATIHSLYSSHSDFMEVTYAGAYGGAINSKRIGATPLRPGNFKLFRIEISPLDVVRGDGIFWRLRQQAENPKPSYYRTEKADGSQFQMNYNDSRFEFFVQNVDASEIKEIIHYEKMPPFWSWGTE